MAGPLDILRGLGGGGGGGAAPRPTMDAFIPEGLKRELATIEAQIKDVGSAADKSAKSYRKLGDARALLPAKKALSALKEAQKSFEETMRSGTATVEDQAAAYDKLAKAQQKASGAMGRATFDMNEARGMLGRTKNILDALAVHKGLAILTAAAKDLNMVLGDVNAQFNILARSGQLADKSFMGLLKSTGMMAGEMRFAALQAAFMGISADDSNKAFVRLTETFGGTSDVASSLRSDWYEWSQLARTTGLSMSQMADLADQGFKRLGETIDETGNNIARMSDITQTLNARFGKGRVNTADFAKAINTLAYSQGFYNQNTRMVIESLGREMATQLALGKSREAAIAGATKNLQMAGKVNIVGIQHFAEGIMGEYQAAAAESEVAGEKYIASLTEKFGAQGETLAFMLKSGIDLSDEGLLAFQNMVQESSELSGNMLENMRVAALQGENVLLSYGMSIGDAQRMVIESKKIVSEMRDIAASTDDESVQKLFNLEPKEKITKEQRAFATKLRAAEAKGEPLTDEAMLIALRDMGGDLEAAAFAAEGDDWKSWVEGGEWFVGVTSALNILTTLMTGLPVALGFVIAGLMGRGPLGKIFARLTGGRTPRMPRMPSGTRMIDLKGGVLKRGAARAAGLGTGVARSLKTAAIALQSGAGRLIKGSGELIKGSGGLIKGAGGKLIKGAGGMLGKGAGLVGKLGLKALGPIAFLTEQAYAWTSGMKNAAKILGKTDVNALERVAAGAANAVSHMTLGIVDAGKLARGETLLHKAAYETSFGMLEAGLAKLAQLTGKETIAGFGDVNVSKEAQMKKQYEHAQKMGWSKEDETLADYQARISKPRQVQAQEDQAVGDAEMATPTTGVAAPDRAAAAGAAAGGGGGGGGAARATASVSQGNLILEVSNWESVLAQSQHDLAANTG